MFSVWFENLCSLLADYFGMAPEDFPVSWRCYFEGGFSEEDVCADLARRFAC